MRTPTLVALGVVALFGPCAVARGQGAQPARAGGDQVPRAATDRATYFSNGALQTIWGDLEPRQVINKRVVEGGTHSINVRIVREGDAPLVHGKSADVWIVTSGTATAITGGQLADPQKRPNGDDSAGKSITGGVEQALQAGDVLYVPAGVPHGFKNVKAFRAFLVRFDTP